MNLAFDLDETLVSTRIANLQAYRSIGIEPPPDYWRIPWESWCSFEDHERKQDAFINVLPKHGRLLPAARVALACGGIVLTNASNRSVEIVLKTFPALDDLTIYNDLGYDRKITWLKQNRPGVYWDDQGEFLSQVRKETRWQTVNVSGL